MAPMIPAERNCVSCGEVEGKYKCPKCSKYTCSLPCNKSHRAEHDNDPAPAPPAADTSAAAAEEEEEAAAAAADEGLSPELRMLFRKYPNLRAQLSQIAGATDAPAAAADFPVHHHPAQRGGRGGGRGGRGGRAAKEPWTKDVGYQNGVAALRRALNGPGGEGLAEYCELVRYQNARKADADADAEDPDAAFRRLRAQRDAQVIGQLIKSEKERG